MKSFTIENDTNNITVHVSAKEAETVPNSERFGTEAALAKLAANWPAARLIEIWNSLPGETPVRKFKDRATAVSRIWKAIQNLNQAAAVTEENPVSETAAVPEPEASEAAPPERVPAETVATPVAQHAPDVAPEGAPAKTKASRAKKAPKPATNASPRENSKTSQVIAMLRREGGATLEDIMTAMGWQKHTTRSMLSAGGSLTKNHGLVIVSEKIGDKRTYSIKA